MHTGAVISALKLLEPNHWLPSFSEAQNTILNRGHIFHFYRVRFRGLILDHNLIFHFWRVRFSTTITYFIFGESDSEDGDFRHVCDGRQAGAIVENGVQNKLPSIWGRASGIYYHQYEQYYSMNRTESQGRGLKMCFINRIENSDVKGFQYQSTQK